MGDPAPDNQLPLFDNQPTVQVQEPHAFGQLNKAPERGIAGGGNDKLPFNRQPELPFLAASPLPTQAPEIKKPKIGDTDEKGRVFNGINYCDPEPYDPTIPWWKR